MLPDDLDLYKLVWSPDDLEGNQVLPSAFRKDDLSGPGHHVSCDRVDMAKRSVMEGIAAGQKANADGIRYIRTLELITTLSCGELRSCTVMSKRAFEVVSDPIEGNNAHCGIRAIRAANVKAKSERAYVEEMRAKLASLSRRPRTFDEAYGAL